MRDYADRQLTTADPTIPAPRFASILPRVPDAAAFRELLRRCSQPDRIAPLLSALGYQPMTPTPSSLCGDIVGERPGSCALLVQPADNFSRADVTRIARPLRDELSRQYLLIIAAPSFRELVFAAWGLDGTLRSLSVDRADVRASDLDTLVELVAAPNEGSSALALRYGRALDRSRVTRRFFVDFREVRTLVSTAWKGLPRAATSERDQLALLFLCRMMFLYFLQRRRHLAGNQAYLVGLWHRWRRNAAEGTFYASVIRPLFFQALNRRPEQRTQEARALGDLPYLNGGLFEIHALERRFPRLDLADESVRHVFDDLLERYRFTTCDVADASADGLLDSAIDPEMLGRVFEGLMLQTRRGDTGTFFTPAGVVDRLVTEALAVGIANHIPQLSLEAARTVVQTCDASGLPPEDRRKLRSQVSALRVLDPACGSGAFLLGVLSRLTRLRTGLEERSVGDVRRDIVATALHGVDVQPDAALLCALRLWLSLAVEDPLTPERVQPLPNLDRRIRQGDALLDPLDIASHVQAADTEVRSCIRSLTPLSRRYLHAEPDERIELRRSLVLAERALAESWIRSLDRRLTREHAELVATSGERDLFGLETADAQAARAALPELARRKDELLRLQSELTEKDAVPFFSFKIHFAESTENGFDMVLSNPPWVRAHRWPAALGRLVKARYAVCRDPGWREGTRLAGAPVAAAAQVDLALLFLERSIALLAPGGTLGILLPAKILRSLFGAAARRMLLRDLTLVSVEDHSLDQRSIFQADSFALSIIARKTPNHSDAPVQITLVRRGMPSFHFAARHSDLPLLPDDHDAPWILAPEGVRQTLRKMQKAGTAIGHRHGMRVRRGVFTGANHVLIVREAIARIGDLATIKTEGAFAKSTPSNTAHASYEALIEAGALRPLVRGSDIAAWQYKSERSIIWVHGPNGSAAPRFPRLDRYLAKHRAVLQKRAGVTSRHATGAIFRLTADTLRPKVAWQDIADTLNAVALPATIRSRLGQDGHLIPLNTVYFLPVSNPDRALLLAAYLNSLPLRTFARVIAERAKDACFRFFAWTIAALPLPDRWDLDDSARVLLRISEDAHSRGFLTTDAESELNGIVADRYGLSPEDRAALHVFDRWLKGLS